MTQTEYNALYAAASRQFPKISRSALIKMRGIYSDAMVDVSLELTKAILTNKADITIEAFISILQQLTASYKSTNEQLILDQLIESKISLHISNWPDIKEKISAGSESIREALTTIIPNTVSTGNTALTNIHESYLIDIIMLSGGKISAVGLSNMFLSVNNILVANIAGRIWQDGYNFSNRVWNVGLEFQEDIKRIILSGLAQGRDIIDIAADLNVYVQSGKQKLITRYGALRSGTSAFIRRIRKQIYYPSLRLIRSELYASLQENAKYMGKVNPACIGLYNWIRATHEDFNCACPEFAAGSPYTLSALPGYPHPNCLCRIQPILRNIRDFQADLKTWVNGGDVPYINDWYTQQYLGFS